MKLSIRKRVGPCSKSLTPIRRSKGSPFAPEGHNPSRCERAIQSKIFVTEFSLYLPNRVFGSWIRSEEGGSDLVKLALARSAIRVQASPKLAYYERRHVDKAEFGLRI